MNNEVIKFSFPSWDKITNDDASLIEKPFCICFRYGGDGDFGFKNDVAQLFLDAFLRQIALIKKDDFIFLKKTIPVENGLYIYNGSCIFEMTINELYSYSKYRTKRDLLKKRGQYLKDSISQPFLLSEDGVYGDIDCNYVNSLIEHGCPFFLRTYYTPQAGETLVFFDNKIINNIKKIAANLGIDFIDYRDINDIPCL